VLQAAASNGQEAIVDWLLTNHRDHVDLRARDKDGAHALDVAAQAGHFTIVKKLVAVDPSLISLPGLNDRPVRRTDDT
jgi:hypothetical protein